MNDYSSKINPKVREMMEQSNSRKMPQMIPIMIQLSPTDEEVHAKASQDQEAYIHQLQDHNKKSVEGIIKVLNSLKAEGTISNYRQYFISNSIALEAESKAIVKLAKLKEVEEISSNTSFKVDLNG
ncbi:hypothetical protein K502DRAFT_351118 [Neoconidiobolus thromboides FSU 785]|nr:hypothetical protein K502DRAFT_351118 [Neoconidiobolus thromboides FSU 785]